MTGELINKILEDAGLERIEHDDDRDDSPDN